MGGKRIQVVVRKRPVNKTEVGKNDEDIIRKKGEYTISLTEHKTKLDLTKFLSEHTFVFDRAFDEHTTNEQLYTQSVAKLVSSALEGTKVTCFAYGQTGSGKTFTMIGSNKEKQTTPGLFLLAARDMFSKLGQMKSHLEIWVSFYEIYSGKLFDLLNEREILHVREDAKANICIVGLSEIKISSVGELMKSIEFGMKARTTGVTGANVDSSRSHAILQIAFKEPKGQIFSKMSFIDLAGNERGADTIKQDKQTTIDGAEINKSLLALKECIRALDQDKQHIPFRGSKLTLILKDSFIGNCKTLMIANISPTKSCCEQTLNTLRYADRVKELKKEPTEFDVAAEERTVIKLIADSFSTPIKAIQLIAPKSKEKKKEFHTSTSETTASDSPIPMIQSNPQKHGLNKKIFCAFGAVKAFAKSPLPFSEKKKIIGSPKKVMTEKSMRQNESNECLTGRALRKFEAKSVKTQSTKGANASPIREYNPPMANTIDETKVIKVCQEHDDLIKAIYMKEKKLYESHSHYMESMVKKSEEELSLLKEVELPGSDLTKYVGELDATLEGQMKEIYALKKAINGLRVDMKKEKQLSHEITALHREIADVYDLSHKANEALEEQLLTVETYKANQLDDQILNNSIQY